MASNVEKKSAEGWRQASDDHSYEQTTTPPPKPEEDAPSRVKPNVDKSISNKLTPVDQHLLRILLQNLHMYRAKWIVEVDLDTLGTQDSGDSHDQDTAFKLAEKVRWPCDPPAGWMRYTKGVFTRMDAASNTWVFGMESELPVFVRPFYMGLKGGNGERKRVDITSRIAIFAQLLGATRIPNENGTGALLCNKDFRYQYTGLDSVDFLTEERAIDLLECLPSGNPNFRGQLIKDLRSGAARVTAGIHKGSGDKWRFNVLVLGNREQEHIPVTKVKKSVDHKGQASYDFGGQSWLPT
uniref:Uncharacterized protein n=1 Tax=Neobodo designis TaxID=312471 RepID=A0A7S1QVA7_NEODS|mmetsp:Transcript_5294/g.16801  ORF Transcript_5294/g.16801 Transcript_5294/m.16801 type:complete len:296 (+) Transcript_5294:47-934(+)